MNFYTVAAKMMKTAEKERKKQLDFLNKVGIDDNSTAELAYEKCMARQMEEHEKIMELGMQLYQGYQTMLATGGTERWYFITVRPPPETQWLTFKNDCEDFINKWCEKWDDYAYCYEQTGKTIEEAGKGFHMHLRIKTKAINYYPTHIKRDALRTFTYVHELCCKVEKIKNLTRTIEYMDGLKEDEEKEPAVAINKIWREKVGVPPLVKKAEAITVQRYEQPTIPT